MKRFKNNISPDSRYVWYTHMSHFRGKSAGQSLKWGITIIYDLSVLIYQRDFYRTAVNFLSRGACKAIKSVFIDPYTRLPDSNNILSLFTNIGVAEARFNELKDVEVVVANELIPKRAKL